MYSHTLTVSTPRLNIPQVLAIDFVTSLISSGVAMVEYFGDEIDNAEDYVEEDMEKVREKILYTEFYFETEIPIDYDSISEYEADKILYEAIENSSEIVLKTDEKDIVIYL